MSFIGCLQCNVAVGWEPWVASTVCTAEVWQLYATRHRASTSMYSLTFCVRFLLPERHQWKARIPDCRSNFENAPVGGQSPAGRPRPLAVCGARFWGRPQVARRSLADDERRLPAMRADPAQPAVRTMSSYRGMDASLELGFALCCHSNATRAPIANPPNSAPKLHPGPCSSVGVWPRTDTHTHRQTDTHTQTRVTTIHFASSTTHAKCSDNDSR